LVEVKHPSIGHTLATDLADRVVPFPTRFPAQPSADLPTMLPVRPIRGKATRRKVRVRTRAIRQVVIVEVGGPLSEVVEELDRAIQLALAQGPRGVACDLSNVLQGADPVAVDVLATAGRHVRDWPGIPVALACPDPQLRQALRAHPLGGHLIVTTSLFSAVSEVLATPTLAVERLKLSAHPTAPRASRAFVTRTLLDWRLSRVIPSACMVVSELVAGSAANAGTNMELSVVWNLGALRLAIRDGGPALLDQVSSAPGLHEPGLTVIAGHSRAFGFLPTSAGGQVVWAVLEAPRPRPLTQRIRSQHASAIRESAIFADGRGLADLPFCAGSSHQPL
jgi:hypothetical protein